jgi:glycosyltransferase involved in cell wall biosynthesis
VYLLTDFTADSSSLVLGLPKEIGSLVRWFERAVGSAADGLLAVSPGQLEVQLPGLRKRPHFIVFNTPEDGDVRPSISSRDMTTVFLYAGILTRQRLDGLIAAIGAVRRLPNVALTIAGSGECEGILRGVAQFAHNVQVIGQVPHEEVLSLTSEASCVLAMYDTSSLNNQIGLPNKLFEAMAYGKPVIVSKHSLAARVVAEHNCGLSVEYGNEKETYEAMKSACDLSWRVLHGTNGRSAFVNLYSWQSQQNGYLSFLGMFDAKAGGNRER